MGHIFPDCSVDHAWLKECTGIVTYASALGNVGRFVFIANVNVSIMSEPDEKLGEHLTNITVEESPLSYWERMSQIESDNTKTLRSSNAALKSVLRSRGALQRRRIHLVCIEKSDKLFPQDFSWYQLSQEQSDRLCEIWPWI